MTLLNVEKVGKYLGGTQIFSRASFMVREKARMGIVGQNGAGKTTLLRLLSGEITPDEGEVTVYGDHSIVRLSQDIEYDPHRTVLQVAMDAFAHLTEMEEELRSLEKKISQEDDTTRRDDLLRRYGSLLSTFERQGGYDAESQARSVLLGLGFAEEDLEEPSGEFSGGEQVRLALGRFLLERPDLMLLDEPTNHLDFEATEWLEGYLKDYPGAVIAVSHDRYFLDRVVDEILEVHEGAVRHFHTNYTGYLKERESRRKQQKKRYEQQQDEIARLKSFIRRYKAGQRHREAKSREKKLERMERIQPPPEYEGGMDLSFPINQPSGDDVLIAEGLTVRREDMVICRDVDLRLNRGDKVALLGGNGAGKSTLLQALMYDGELSQGEIKWGKGVRIGYFPQDLAGLDEQNTVLQQMYRDHPDLGLGGAREHLARFGFYGDEVFTQVSQLSGGERSRLIFAQLSLKNATVLLLDEPTNHLDLPARGDLETALRAYTGAVVFVTHDRYFVDEVATKIWLLIDGELLVHHGDYSQLRKRLQKKKRSETKQQENQQKSSSKQTDSCQSASERHRRPPDEEQVNQLEQEIIQLEERKEELAEQLAEPDSYAAGKGKELVEEFDQLKTRLQKLYREWEQMASLLEEA